MKRLVLSVAAMLTASIVVVNAERQAHKGHASGSQLLGSVHVVFSSDDVRVIREYYAPRYRALPPGLQKKYARTGQLPPGWQKKLQRRPYARDDRHGGCVLNAVRTSVRIASRGKLAPLSR